MNSTCRTAVAAAVAGGYVLGRTRKAKVAFAIGTFLAGRRFGLTPTALAAEGLRQLRESPQLAELREQIGGELLDAVRAAATTSTDRRFAAFAGTLRDRMKEDLAGDEPEDGADGEDEDGGGGEPSGERERGKAPAKRAASRKAAPDRKRAAGRKPGPAKKAAKKAAAKKTASDRSRSAASGRGR